MASTPRQQRRSKAPKSPKPKHCSILDSDAEVDFEIQNAPPFRILPKVRNKPKTPPAQRCKKSPGRSPHETKARFVPSDFESDVIFYKRPTSPPRQVTFRDQCSALHRDVRVPSGLVDILSNMEPCAPHRLRPTPINHNQTLRKEYIKANNSCQTDLTAIDQKPKIENVQIVRRTPSSGSGRTLQRTRACRSNEELNKVQLAPDVHHLNLTGDTQSSFVDPDAPVTLSRRSMYFELGEYQTLLKHSPKDHVYSLPQPQCYGDDTLRAVKRITDKYDTCQRRLIQAASFAGKEMDALPEALTQAVVSAAPVPDIVLSAPEEINKKSAAPEVNVIRLDLFYRGVGSNVHVCQCAAEYLTGALSPGKEHVEEWALAHSGVPVWVLDTGQGHRPRQLQVFLADNSTAFPLWSNRVCYLTNYTRVAECEHAFFLSESLSLKGKLRFSDADQADAFFSWFKDATADPDDELWKVSSKRAPKKKARSKLKVNKSAISSPCNFAHVTQIDLFSDTLKRQFRHSMGEQQTEEMFDTEHTDFRPRLPTS